MKPVSEALKLETEGLEHGTKAFEIVQSRRMFEILSSNIYKDKVLAVIREYGCNAYDAHVMVGKENEPFEVHLPNEFEPWFAIRDFGPGLDHEMVLNLYTTYGLSTKTSENKSVGMFGLGSKSAFAYTDQFTIVSAHGGVRRTYAAFLSEDGVPTITLLIEEDTEDSTGLTIQLPAKAEDFSTFARRAESVFYRFPVMPIITGNIIEIEQVKYTMTREGFKLRHEEHGGRAMAIQGTVAYPIDRHSFSDGKLSSAQSDFLHNVPVDFIFPIGTLDIAASREDLNYNNSTQEALIAAIDYAMAEVPKQFDDALTKCKTLWEAKLYYREWLSQQSWVNKVILRSTGKKIRWNDEVLDEDNIIRIKFFDIVEEDVETTEVDAQGKFIVKKMPMTKYWSCSVQGWNSYNFRHDRKEGAPTWGSILNVPVHNDVLLIFQDKKYKAPTRSMREVFHNTRWNKVLVIKDYTEEQMDLILNKLEGMPPENVKFLSEFPEPLSPKMKQEIKKVFEVKHYYSGTLSLHEVDYDVTQETPYFMLYKGTVVTDLDPEGTSTTGEYYVRHLLYFLDSLGQNVRDFKFLNYSHRKIAIQNNWTQGHDVLKARIDKFRDNKELMKAVAYFRSFDHNQRYCKFRSYMKFCGENLESVPQYLLAPYLEALPYIMVIDQFFGGDHSFEDCRTRAGTISSMIKLADTIYPKFLKEPHIRKNERFKKLERIKARYPLFNKMLNYMGQHNDYFQPSEIIDYVKAIHAQRSK